MVEGGKDVMVKGGSGNQLFKWILGYYRNEIGSDNRISDLEYPKKLLCLIF